MAPLAGGRDGGRRAAEEMRRAGWRWTECSLHEEEPLRFQARLLEELSDAVMAMDREGRITYANQAALARYAPGRSGEEVLGQRLEDLCECRWIDPRDSERASHALETRGVWRGEVVHVRHDGVSWPVEAAIVALKDDEGRPAGCFAVLRDVSERKASEDALRASREELRALALRIQTIREEEKARIARDLHDELGQQVTALQLVVADVGRRLEAAGPRAREAIGGRLAFAAELLDGMAGSIRRIASELRPAVLDQLGLAAALEQEAQRFERRTGIGCRVEAGGAPELPPEIATALYRIAQEALTNVARHARATMAAIALAARPEEVSLAVEDDGCGVPSGVPPGRGLGLLGMRERARALGGDVRIGPRAGGGTRVVATVPLPGAREGGDR